MHIRFLRISIFASAISLFASAQPVEAPVQYFDRWGSTWDSVYGSDDEGGGGSSYLGVDIDDVSAERLSALKLKEEHGAEITMVDQDAPAGKAGLHDHDVIVSVNGTAVDSAAQLRRMIKETPPGRIVTLGISRDGQPLSIKVQLADRRKSMAWEPKSPEMPKLPQMPSMPDFDLPVSVVIVHSSARSGLMVENISPQLGDFFGVKDGRGILVRSVEKGSRGEKAGFHAGDVIIKVNNQAVHDTSDFTHVLRSLSGSTTAVTVMRDKREQNLTLSLPQKKDSGNLIEETFDDGDFSAETQRVVSHAGNEIARMTPALMEKVEIQLQQQLHQAARCPEMQKKLRDLQQNMIDQQQQLIEKDEQNVLHEVSPDWAEI
jgi:serine protease Do